MSDSPVNDLFYQNVPEPLRTLFGAIRTTGDPHAGQNYTDYLSAILTSPKADFSSQGLAGQLLRQLMGSGLPNTMTPRSYDPVLLPGHVPSAVSIGQDIPPSDTTGQIGIQDALRQHFALPKEMAPTSDTFPNLFQQMFGAIPYRGKL